MFRTADGGIRLMFRRRRQQTTGENPQTGLTYLVMKTIEVSDEVHAKLQRLALGSHRTPDEVLASFLRAPLASPEAAEPLAAFVLSAAFRAPSTDADKYLALLGWIATHHSEEFAEFIRRQAGGRRYLSLSREEIWATCRHHEARQIDGTRYWAILNIGADTRRRFLGRLLDFIGYRDEVIEFACGAIGLRQTGRRGHLAVLVA